MNKPFYQLAQRQDIIRQFTPNWFTMSMGTGVVALILPELARDQAWLWQTAGYLWQLNTLIFSLFTLLYLLRWIIYPHEARLIFSHPSMALFLGAIPMGLATVLNGFLKFGLPLYGEIAVSIAQYLWYADVILAVLIGIVVPFCMFSRQQHQLGQMTALWLLPIVACEVAATSGGLLLPHLAVDQHSIMILVGSYVLWGMSVLPAFAVLTILMLRLALHQLPSKELAMSSWLALGPIGTGALALLVLGEQAAPLLAAYGLMDLGVLAEQLGIFASFILLGFGLWWLSIAVLTTLSHVKNKLSFNLGWWALTFPLGVFCLAIFQLATQTHLDFIEQIATVFAGILVVLWSVVMFKTLQGIYRGHLFFSPCLKNFLEQEQASTSTAHTSKA